MNPAMRMIIAKAVTNVRSGSAKERALDTMIEKLCIIPLQKAFRQLRHRSTVAITLPTAFTAVIAPTAVTAVTAVTEIQAVAPITTVKQFGSIGIQTDLQEIPQKPPRSPFEPIAVVVILTILMMIVVVR